MRKLAFALAAILAASSFAACGGPAPAVDTTEPSETTAPAEVEYPYYGGNDFGGKTYKFLNVKYDLWNMMPQIMPEELNGETVNDAVYMRNEKVMAKLNCQLEEVHHETYDELGADLNKLIMAGDDVYAAAYVPLHKILAGLTGGYYAKLNDVDTLHLDQPYWDQTFLETSSIDGANYFATGSAHLMINSGMWMLFFNEDMMDANKLAYPYDLVREGKWTVDAMRTYTKAVANLNGDDVYGKDSDGNAIYGFVSFANVIPKFIYAAGAEYVTKDKNGELVINCNSSKFIETCQKLAEFFGVKGEVLMASSDSTLNTYYQLYFEKQKCLFFGGELKTASLLRNMEQSFGIIPIPKIDESQKEYYVTSVHQCPAFVIPVTNSAPEEVGLIFDALSYESDASVLDLYFNEYVEQKGLRNEDSIEMLDIIVSSRSYDIGVVYGWITTLETALKTAIQEGNTDISSAVATNEASITENLNKMLEAFKDS
ncbi:MAG: hypothetical protein IJF67_09375 [Clostridia bacterium]|nr:hypothetical protein [Clostridia bacterium]